jgi:hypothetical protein
LPLSLIFPACGIQRDRDPPPALQATVRYSISPIELARGKFGDLQGIFARLSLERPFEFGLVVSLDRQRRKDRVRRC